MDIMSGKRGWMFGVGLLLAAIGSGLGLHKGQVISGVFNGVPRDFRVAADGGFPLGSGTATIGTANVQGRFADGTSIITTDVFPVLLGGADRSAGGKILRDVAVAADGALAITHSGVTQPTYLTAGTATIGSVGAIVNALPAGNNNIGDVDVVTLPSLVAGTATVGSIGALVNALPAGDNNIGNVDVVTVPALVDGTATIGSVNVINAVVLGPGTATLGSVTALGTAGTPVQQGAGASTAGTLRVGVATDDVVSTALADDSIALEAGTATVGSIGAIVNELPAGTQNIGDVDVLTLPALVAGTATVGSVQIVNAQGNPVQVEIGDGTETALVTAAGELSVLATAQPGTDIGDVTLTAGTATIGTIGAIVGALPAGANALGSVTVSSLPALVAGTATIGSVQLVNAQTNPAQVEIGDGTETALVTAAGELNVIATAQPGVDVGDVTLTAGTATVGSIGAIINALPAGDNNIGNMDVATLPALVAGTATVGSVQVINAQSNPVQVEIGDGIETALVTAAGELSVLATAQPGTDIGDVTLTTGTATIGTIGAIVGALPAGANAIGSVTVSSLPALVAGTATVGSVVALRSTEVWTDPQGTSFIVQRAFTTVTTAGTQEIAPVAAQGAGNSILVLGWIIATNTQVTVQFETGGGAAISNQGFLGANGGWTSDYEVGWWETNDNEALELQVSAAATVSVYVRYVVR